jgi:hypothetical protein
MKRLAQREVKSDTEILSAIFKGIVSRNCFILELVFTVLILQNTVCIGFTKLLFTDAYLYWIY